MITAASPDDIAALVEIERVCFGADTWSETLVRAELDAPSRSVITARHGNQVIGYASVSVTVDLADLLRIAVHPGARRRGYGRRLLEDVMRLAALSGAQRMLLEVASDNAAAMGLFRAAGFTDIECCVGYYGEGRDALVLGRPFDGSAAGSVP